MQEPGFFFQDAMQTYENHDAMQTFWFSVIVLATGKIEWDLTN